MPLSFPGGAASTVLASAFPLVAPDGIPGAPSYSFSGEPTTGIYRVGASQLGLSLGGTLRFTFAAGVLVIAGGSPTITFGTNTSLISSPAQVLSLQNGVNAQAFRVYKTTTGPQWIGFDTADASFSILSSTFAMQNNAAAQAGTLTNAPVAGNPTKWIPINDNGTIRNIPAW